MLAQLASVRDEIERLGFDIIGIGPAAHYQAQRLLDQGLEFPLFLDPDHRVAQEIGVKRQTMTDFVFNRKAWARYLRALLRHRRQGRITGHYSNVPALVVVDESGRTLWRHIGTGLGDYPPLVELLDSLRAISGKNGGTGIVAD